jgi:hypothetical protein
MSPITPSRAALAAAIIALSVGAAGFWSASPVDAHSTGYKHGHAKHKGSHKSKRKYSRPNSGNRDPAVFASEVDLSRPGGPQKFFEMLNEENR